MGANKDNDLGRRASGVRFLVLGWLCLAATIAYVHRGALAVPIGSIGTDLQLSTKQLGWVLSSFYWGYAIFQVPSGWLGDRWGPRLALTLFALMWSTATALIGFTPAFVTLVLCQFINGMAQAGVFPCCVKSISRWFPASRRALPTGMLASAMSLGALLATSLTGSLLAHMSWQAMFPYLALPGLLWALGFCCWFRNEPAEHSWVNDAELDLIREGEERKDEAPTKPATPWATLLTSPQMLFISGQQFFRAAGYIFYTTWFPTYLQETRGVSIMQSGYLTAIPLLAIAVGAPLGGAISDWIQRRTGSRRYSRQGWAIFNMLACAAFILAAFFVEDSTQAVLLIAAGSFHSGMGGPAAYTITMDVGGRHVSTVFSLMNMAGNIGAALCPMLVTFVVDFSGWNLVLLMFVAIYAASAACWLFVNPMVPIVRQE